MRTDLDGAVTVNATPASMTVRTFRALHADPIQLVPTAAAAPR
jgi:hypothetical protein